MEPTWPAHRLAAAKDAIEAEPVSADRVTVTRRIAAPAHAIFVLVSDPARHVDIDGSGMLQAAPHPFASPLTAVDQTFDMNMDLSLIHI